MYIYVEVTVTEKICYAYGKVIIQYVISNCGGRPLGKLEDWAQ